MTFTSDVVVIGAGVAGLTAAVQLVRGKQSVTILEARDRLGGRVFTEFDSELDATIEFGAEFIDGLAPEILEPLQEHNVPIAQVEGEP